MDHFDRSVLYELTDKTDGSFISIYMPTSKAGQDTRQNTIRLRNMLRSAEEQCISAGVRRPDARAMLAPAAALLDDSEFWQHQQDGLALFAGRGFFRAFRLPIAFRELTVVADRPHVKPLLEMFVEDGEFMVLALSLNHVRLLACRQRESRRVDIVGIPASFDDYMRFVEQSKQVQFHTRTPPRPGQRSAMFHAAGSESDQAVHKKNVTDYLRLVHQAVDRQLTGRRTVLVLAGADFVRATYRAVSGYRHIAERSVAGCPDELSDAELRQRAWAVVQPTFAASLHEAIGAFEMAEGTPRGGDNLPDIVRAAHAGAVATLFVSLDQERWGRFDPTSGQAIVHEQRGVGDVDLLDLAVVHTLLHHGRVFVLPTRPGNSQPLDEQPGGGPLAGRPAAALFRAPGVMNPIAQSAE